MRDETVTLLIQPNENVTYRYSTIKFIDEQGVTGETVLITQKSGTSRVINVETPGSLEAIMSEDEKNKTEDLKITGSLNSFDFEFIRTMPLLNTLISGMPRSKPCRQVAWPRLNIDRDIACILEENLKQGLLWFGHNVLVHPRIGGGDSRLCFCQYIGLNWQHCYTGQGDSHR